MVDMHRWPSERTDEEKENEKKSYLHFPEDEYCPSDDNAQTEDNDWDD